jgi:UDP-glucose 4-epimerase
MKVLITGCHGFIGSSVADHAIRQGHQVFGVDRAEQPEAIAGMDVLRCALDQPEFIDLLTDYRPEMVVHAAGSASVGYSFQEPREDFHMAVGTWGALLDAVRKADIRPFVIFPSSAAVYGNPQRLPVSEQDPLRPISPYGFHKLICEQLAQEYVRCFGFHIVAARLFSTVGPRQHRLLVWELFRQAVEDHPAVTIQGSGLESRDFLHIEDISEYFLRLAERRSEGFLAVNIGSGIAATVREVAGHILKSVGSTRRIVTLNKELPGDPKTWEADVSLLHSLVPHRPSAIHKAIGACVDRWLLEESFEQGGMSRVVSGADGE